MSTTASNLYLAGTIGDLHYENSSSLAANPTRRAVHSRQQQREIKSCLPFLFKFTEDLAGWSWHSDRANMTALVMPGAEKNALVISVVDDVAGESIELWTTEIRLIGLWRRRVRQLAGEALILCQMRPRCPKCSKALVIGRRHDDSAQFFGCPNYKSPSKCRGGYNLTDHDIERAL